MDALHDVWVVQTTQVSCSILISGKLMHALTNKYIVLCLGGPEKGLWSVQ